MDIEIMSKEEFQKELTNGDERYQKWDGLYMQLRELALHGKISKSDMMRFARHKWCVHCPDAVIAVKVSPNLNGQDNWKVNNCDTLVHPETIKKRISKLFGFDEQQMKLIGTPYYEATDWQFVQFSTGVMDVRWLYTNGELFLVEEE